MTRIDVLVLIYVKHHLFYVQLERLLKVADSGSHIETIWQTFMPAATSVKKKNPHCSLTLQGTGSWHKQLTSLPVQLHKQSMHQALHAA